MPGSQKGLYSRNTEFAWESYHQKRGMQIASDAKLAKIIWNSLQFNQQSNPDHTQELFTSQGSTIHKQIVLHIFHQLLNELQVCKLKSLLNVPDDSDQCYLHTSRVMLLKSSSHLSIYIFLYIYIHKTHTKIHSLQYKNKPSRSGFSSGFQEHLFLWTLQ